MKVILKTITLNKIKLVDFFIYLRQKKIVFFFYIFTYEFWLSVWIWRGP